MKNFKLKFFKYKTNLEKFVSFKKKILYDFFSIKNGSNFKAVKFYVIFFKKKL